MHLHINTVIVCAWMLWSSDALPHECWYGLGMDTLNSKTATAANTGILSLGCKFKMKEQLSPSYLRAVYLFVGVEKRLLQDSIGNMQELFYAI